MRSAVSLKTIFDNTVFSFFIFLSNNCESFHYSLFYNEKCILIEQNLDNGHLT